METKNIFWFSNYSNDLGTKSYPLEAKSAWSRRKWEPIAIFEN